MTRQRKLQIEYLRQGRCQSCGDPAQGRSFCDRCARRHGVKRRHPLRSQWEKTDWSLTDKEIAAALDVTTTAVKYQRRKVSKNLL